MFRNLAQNYVLFTGKSKKSVFQIKSMDLFWGLSTYLTTQDTFVSETLSTSDGAISSLNSYRHKNPISDARIAMLLAPSHAYYPPWIQWQYLENSMFLFFFGKHFSSTKLSDFGTYWEFQNLVFFWENEEKKKKRFLKLENDLLMTLYYWHCT